MLCNCMPVDFDHFKSSDFIGGGDNPLFSPGFSLVLEYQQTEYTSIDSLIHVLTRLSFKFWSLLVRDKTTTRKFK